MFALALAPLAAFGAFAATAAAVTAKGPAVKPAMVDQGWTPEERDLWWYSPQGSKIVPYDWFLKLETAQGGQRFAADDHLATYGFLSEGPSPRNPDALPIGLARETDSASPQAWVGMSCSACHTATISYRGKSTLLEGVGAMVDIQRFDRDLSAALAATSSDDAKFDRFATALGAPADGRAALRDQLAQVAKLRADRTAMNAAPHDYGPGRVDALGAIMNALTVTALDKPSNARPADAPVRLPWVWNSPFYSRVQYDGSISNAGIGPLLRNIGQTLGVYGTVDIKPTPVGYASSVKLGELQTLEGLLRKLQAPAWPAMLPKIDKAKAAHGATIFAQACESCHGVKAKDADGLIPVVMSPLDEIGTDPRAARNFMTRPADTGPLEGRSTGVFAGAPFGPKAGAATIVGHISTGVAGKLPRDQLQAGLTAYRTATAANPSRLDAYKAVPLAGVWAGAPYLHNGSVANMHELLTPPAGRAARFVVGGRDYDPVTMGYPAAKTGPGFVFDTTAPGNSNAGHNYGTNLPEADKTALIEYLKTL